ncbi:hypothetical protein [Mesorhizobium sp. M1A.F.Ca.ET.072.01.1.1]|nr:hypothetical protein [Mesorhizobium sp. M1A.F.Ca.ET.072.01.1.1]
MSHTREFLFMLLVGAIVGALGIAIIHDYRTRANAFTKEQPITPWYGRRA